MSPLRSSAAGWENTHTSRWRRASIPGRRRSRSVRFHKGPANASMSTVSTTCLPSRSTRMLSSIHSAMRPASRTARTNSSASSTARSAEVASSSITSTSVNSVGRCDL
ncbi:hypothetical protein [Catenulispora pinisilvae]|uniref:hypothetical protein n=1 Tax=Catenulispora pinisilvae TaxID=2705253 RepID=UPI00189225E6|nr:hypothetical protein [Catenulispora pinisilvae]